MKRKKMTTPTSTPHHQGCTFRPHLLFSPQLKLVPLPVGYGSVSNKGDSDHSSGRQRATFSNRKGQMALNPVPVAARPWSFQKENSASLSSWDHPIIITSITKKKKKTEKNNQSNKTIPKKKYFFLKKIKIFRTISSSFLFSSYIKHQQAKKKLGILR